jgi:HrpA-like RNA helicase
VEKLPVYAKKKEFLDAYEKTQVIILQSSAGSGKSTQIPQYLLELDSGRTLVTEPRAIAVESVGNRVMAELASCWAPEGIVGYLCGPNFNVRSYTRVLYMTEHEFINQVIQDDSDFLDAFDTFLIDEAHELRKPQIVILAILKNHLLENPNKRLIVTSATLEAELFKDYFKELQPIFIQAKTPTYSVSTTYNLFPDLDGNLGENTVAHIKAILDVGLLLTISTLVNHTT